MAGLWGVEKSTPCISLVPADVNGTTPGKIFFTFKNHRRAKICIQTGALNASASITVGIQQATAIAGTSAKTLLVPNYYTYSNVTPGTTDIPTKVTATQGATAFTITGSGGSNSLPNTLIVIPVEARWLDAANAFDCCGVLWGAAAAAATVISAWYELHDPTVEDSVPYAPRVD